MTIKRIFFTALLAASYCVVSLPMSDTATIDLNQKIGFEYAVEGTIRCSMFSQDSNGRELIGSMTITPAKIFDSLDTIDLDTLDNPHAVILITLIRAVKSMQALDKVVILGDVYIPVKHRGKGFAQLFVNRICQQAFHMGTTLIALHPGPFEMENGKLIFLPPSPDYADKQQRLIKLYQKCGFIIGNNDSILFMYRRP